MADSWLPPSLTMQSDQMGAIAGGGAIDEERQSNMEMRLSERVKKTNSQNKVISAAIGWRIKGALIGGC